MGALALNLLTGLAGQVSLGHAGFIAAGAFTTAVLVEHRLPSPLLALPAAAVVGATLGVVVGIPALRLKGLYLALGTLALHHVVLYACGEFQNHWGANTGVSIPPPRLGAWVLRGTSALVLRADGDRRAGLDPVGEPPALARRPRVDGDPRSGDRGRVRRDRRGALQGPRLRLVERA